MNVLLALVLCSVAAVVHPARAVIYTTAITAANAPAMSGSTLSNVVGGLYQACLSSKNTSATSIDRMALTIRTVAMSDFVGDVVGLGTYYVAGYYDATTDGWYWNDGVSGTTTQFGQGPSCKPVSESLASRWVAGYPKNEPGTTTIGKLKYIVYDGTQKGWINVAGTASYDGVACECKDVPLPEKSNNFPWWAILIIVLGSVVVIAVVVIVVVCCCCCKKKKANRYDGDEINSDDEEEEMSDSDSKSFTSNSGAVESRDARSHSTGSFTSRSSRYSPTSKGTGLTGASDSSYSYSYSDSSRSSTNSGGSSSGSSIWSDSDSRSSSSSESI
jgi:hypothetical protein